MGVLEKVLEGLMATYQERVPDVSKITDALVHQNVIEKSADISNDHIAFRTMGVPQLGIQSFEKIFLHYGYTARDNYFFEHKKLNARWYAPPKNNLPRIFISELQVADFSENVQQIIKSYTNEVTTDPVDSLDLNNAEEVISFLHAPLWRTPTSTDYLKLLEISEYAAWVIYNRYYLNHYTISVDQLKNGYNTLEEFNAFLNNLGVVLSDAGGVIKQSKDGLLLQSATAKEDLKREHKREGFETANADKIFESTFTSQTSRK